MNLSTFDMEMLHLKNGGRWEIWLAFNEFTAAFIKTQHLTRVVTSEHPAAMEVAAGAEVAPRMKTATRPPIVWDGGKFGGMRTPHLHHAGDLYMLTEKQWVDFSGQILGKLKEKLDGAQKVTFDQLMVISDAVHTL